MNWIDNLVPGYGTVTGQYVAISYDSSDADLTPDVQPLNGTITLTPTVTAGRIDTALAQILSVKVRVFGGQIVDDEDQPGVRIISTDTNLGVQDWAWTAYFDFESGLKLKPLPFKVATGETLNLTSGVVPVDSAPYQIVQRDVWDASVVVEEGAQWGATVNLSGGILDFDFTVPPGAVAWWHGDIPDGTSLDDMRGPTWEGAWDLKSTSYTTLTGTFPPTPNGRAKWYGQIFVFGRVSALSDVSTQILSYTNGQKGSGEASLWYRSAQGYNFKGAEAWSPWVRLDEAWNRGRIPQGTNVDALRSPGQSGVYQFLDIDVPTFGGALPEGLARSGTLDVVSGHQWQVTQRISEGGTKSREWTRTLSSPVGPTWHPWQETARASDVDAVRGEISALVDAQESGGPGATAGITHSMLVDQYARARGGSIGTGGVAAVAIRWDHNPDLAISRGLPDMHRDLGIPVGWCHYSQQLGKGGHNTPWATIQDYALTHGLEVWGHTQTHQDAADTTGYLREMVTSRAEMEAAMPQVRVDGLCVPGVDGTRYQGWINTNSIDDFYAHEAGRIAMETYAVCSGYMGGGHHPQTGRIEQGLNHLYLQDMSLTQAMDAIREAQAAGTKIQFMIHPQTIGEPGFITVDEYRSLLEHLGKERDAGRLAILSLSGWHLADARHAYRDDLAAGNTLTGALAGTASYSIPMGSRAWGRGSVRETVVKVACPSGGGATVVLTRNGVEAGRLVIPAGDTSTHVLRRCQYVSLTRATQDIDLDVTGAVDVKGVHLYAI